MKWLGSLVLAVRGVAARVPSLLKSASRIVDDVVQINDRAQVVATTAAAFLPAERAVQLRAAAAAANGAVNRVRTAQKAVERAAAVADVHVAVARIVLLADPDRS